jgi:hypothetical protein
MEDRITSLSESELVVIGGRVRAPYLLEQGSYTIALARAEGEALAKLMAPGLVDKVAKIHALVAKAYEDKTVMAAEAQLATGSQNAAVRLLKEWGRRAVARTKAARRTGAPLPQLSTVVLDGRTVPALIAQAQRQVSLMTEHAATMDKLGAPTQPLIDEGRALCEALIAADGGQELTRRSSLPSAVAKFYVWKAELYIGLKMINDAGHELYAHYPLSSARFNLSLLYRRGPGAPPATEGAPVAPPAPAAPAKTP